MTELTATNEYRSPDLSAASLKGRYAAEKRFKFYGVLALAVAAAVLGLLLFSIIGKGYSAFMQTQLGLTVQLDPEVIDPDGGRDPYPLPGGAFTGFGRLLVGRRRCSGFGGSFRRGRLNCGSLFGAHHQAIFGRRRLDAIGTQDLRQLSCLLNR